MITNEYFLFFFNSFGPNDENGNDSNIDNNNLFFVFFSHIFFFSIVLRMNFNDSTEKRYRKFFLFYLYNIDERIVFYHECANFALTFFLVLFFLVTFFFNSLFFCGEKNTFFYTFFWVFKVGKLE